MKKQTCRIDGCNKRATTIGLCTTCYNRAYYWSRKPLKAAAGRISQLHRWEQTVQERLGSQIAPAKRRAGGRR